MGATVQGATIASKTIENDDDVELDRAGRRIGGGVPAIAFGTFGTSPAVAAIKGGSGHCRLRVTSGSGAQAANANAFTVTAGRTVRKAFLSSTNATPFFYVSSVSGAVVTIGVQAAPVASTTYEIELLLEF